MVQAHYADLGDGDFCAVHNCLGHAGRARGSWSALHTKYGTHPDIVVVLGSDGLWDMLTNEESEELPSILECDADSLVNTAVARWTQEWCYYWYGEVVSRCEKIDQPDDVSCSVIYPR
jgi:serine/threonine protein phosphatase PrpC